MKNIRYGIVEEVYSLSGESRTSYGIAAYADPEENGSATVIASERDITSDRERLLAFVHTCNRLELSPIHLNDAIADFLAE